MTEEQILSLAEVRWNLTGDSYDQAEREVREMVADGWTYTLDYGWTP